MRGRLPVILLAFVALSLVLSLVAALAPGASAQDSIAPDGGQGNWVRHNVPTAQQWQAASNAGALIGEPRNCAITLEGFYPKDYIGMEHGRWFCARFYQ